ncbi:bax inhibitor 1-like [Solanum dulcamara]|uniref:bax inhibitor 1-like n=1 Tax=Solanum dulcamara TaxID=45834 RepID=UPI0024850EE1|nr:bax inhibitor 1-like [Solanum dulcamara]
MAFLVNAVKLYFNRNWRRQDMMSSAPIPEHARTRLNRVYLTLFCATSAAAYGSHLEAGGLFTVLCSEASLLWLYFTPPWRVWKRVLLLIVAAFCFGASVGTSTKCFFEIDQLVVVRFLQGAAIVFGCFWFAARTCRERSQIYTTVLIETCTLMLMLFDITQWMLKVYVLLALFMGYLVLYSQEILYDAHFGEIDFVNCAFTVFFCLPAIMVHAVRLCLDANIEQHGQN